MNYNFVEIGTSDFDTLIQECSNEARGLSIEPIKYYLDRLPEKPNVTKIQAAVSDVQGFIDVYYIPDEHIATYALPWWVRGSNSVGRPHPYTISQIGEKIYNRLVRIDKVPTITWRQLIDTYDIETIDYLKVDTEGFDHIIINAYLNECDLNPHLFANKIRFEALPAISNMEETEKIVERLKDRYNVERTDMDVVLTKKVKHEKAYVLYATSTYFNTVQGCVESLKAVSSLPIYVYMINSSLEVKNATTIRWDCDIDTVPLQRDFIDRKDTNLYRIMIQRPAIVRDCLLKYADTVAYIDSDSVATPLADTIFDYYKDSYYPYFVEGVFDYMLIDGRGGAESRNDLSTTLEAPACELFDVNQSVRNKYRQTGYFVAGRYATDFLSEWWTMCNHPLILTNPNHYAAFHEETILNVLLWKYKIQTGLPLIYVNGKPEQTSDSDWYKAPEKLLFYHGEKNIDRMREMIKKINVKPLRILYLAPHLSTGGMPQFLLKRIETMIDNPEVELYVVEYANYSDEFTVQKDRIRDLVKHFYSLGENKENLINIIRDNQIDVIHLDETPEWFECYNQTPLTLIKQIYSPDRTWKVVETCHNIGEGHNVKRYFPDAYALCTPYHLKTFTDNVYKEVITYPIDKMRVDRDIAKEVMGLDKNKKHVLNVGLWTPGKNQTEGIEISRKYPEMIFHFVGNQAVNFKDYWEPLMQNLPENVNVCGERHTGSFYQACDILMFNSTFECNPIVLREAIGYNLPIVARNLPQYEGMFDKYILDINTPLEQIRETSYDLSGEMNSEQFGKRYVEFYKKVKEIKRSNIKINQHFVDEPFIEITGDSDSLFTIRVYDEDNTPVYQNTILCNSWVKLFRKYYTKWTTKIWQDGVLIYENILDYSGKRVFITFESSSLGDTIAWIPYCEEFRKKHNCHVIVCTHKNFLFKKSYPQLEFVEPGTTVHNLYGLYRIGWFYDDKKEPVQPNTIPLQQTATNILGLEYKEIVPKIDFKPKRRKGTFKYVTIATNSTAGCKFYTKEGWQEVINYITSRGYKVINVSKEKNPFENCSQIEDTSLENTMNIIHHSEFLIALSSGLAWLAWGMNKHVVMISNFTEKTHEFQSNCTRIVKESVCHGCWNKPDIIFDKGDWEWCPFNKGTERQFECHKSISPQEIIKIINPLIP